MSALRLVRFLSAAAVIVAGVVFVMGYAEPTLETLDHHNYRVAVEGMRSGQSYYEAYDRGFREVYGPIPAVRDVRLPTVYATLSLAPSGTEYVVFAVMAVVAGLIPVAVAKFPPSGPLVTIYLLSLAVANNGVAQYLHAEFWIVPAALGAVFALDRGYERTALGLGLLAFAIREQGLLLLIGIGAYLWSRGRQRVGVIFSGGIAVMGWLFHVWALWPYVDTESVSHTPLHLGENPFVSLMATLDFGLGIPGIGLVFLIGAFGWARRHGLVLAVGLYLAIPVLTLWVNRQYWGLLVVPLAAVLTFELVWEALVGRSIPDRAQAGPSQP